jgi:hypothetical protein
MFQQNNALRTGFRALHKVSLVAFLICQAILAYAQYTNVMISNQDWPEETSIYINPKNVNHLVAGANLSAFYYSYDGGRTWGIRNMTSTLGVYGDPCLAIDTAGNIFFLHLSDPPGQLWLDRIVCQKSENYGLSWNDGSSIGKNDPKHQDKEWIAVNPHNNDLYVTWTQFDLYGSSDTANKSVILFSKSTDEGESWSQPYRLSKVAGDCIDSDNTTEGAVPAVGPDQEIYVAWAGPAGLVFDRSLDGGLTWLEEDIFIDEMPTGWDYMIPGIFRANGLPITACDRSNGPYRGTIYVNWSDQRNGVDDTDIWLSKSADGGDTWSDPIRVNDDPPGKQQFFTWMTVDQITGNLWFVFYDRRNYSDTRTDVFIAVSTDGGNTFSNFSISETPFIPNANIFFGDYSCITAHDGIVRPIWTRLDGINLSVYTALIDTMLTSVPEPGFLPFAIEQSYPNPFFESTVFSFKVKKAGYVSLEVRDILGNKVDDLIQNEFLEEGKYLKVFDPGKYNIPSGVYYFTLKGNGMNRQQKMLYLN